MGGSTPRCTARRRVACASGLPFFGDGRESIPAEVGSTSRKRVAAPEASQKGMAAPEASQKGVASLLFSDGCPALGRLPPAGSPALHSVAQVLHRDATSSRIPGSALGSPGAAPGSHLQPDLQLCTR
eukprot:365464-Chlamydomonas_euryale.AAC.1